jgi:hypothetical protein
MDFYYEWHTLTIAQVMAILRLAQEVERRWRMNLVCLLSLLSGSVFSRKTVQSALTGMENGELCLQRRSGEPDCQRCDPGPQRRADPGAGRQYDHLPVRARPGGPVCRRTLPTSWGMHWAPCGRWRTPPAR